MMYAVAIARAVALVVRTIGGIEYTPATIGRLKGWRVVGWRVCYEARSD
jgi:hypothetical protein